MKHPDGWKAAALVNARCPIDGDTALRRLADGTLYCWHCRKAWTWNAYGQQKVKEPATRRLS